MKLSWEGCCLISRVFTRALETWQTPQNQPGCNRWSYLFKSCFKPLTICGRMYVAIPELGDGASHATVPIPIENIWEPIKPVVCRSQKDLDTEVFQLAIRNLAALRDSSASCQVLGKNLAWMGTMQAKRRTTAPPMWRLWISQAIQELMHIPKSTCWSNAVKNAGRPQQNP